MTSEETDVKLEALKLMMFELMEKVKSLEADRSLSNPLEGYMMNDEFDSGDIAWMLSATALVLLMTVPGLTLYYAGMASHKRNLMTIAMQSFTICCEVTLAFMIFGYSLSFSGGIRGASKVSQVIGNTTRFFLIGLESSYGHGRAPNIPEPLFFAFQAGFAVITAAIMCGASADRMKFSSMLLLVFMWHLLVYCPIAHSNWDHKGFLNTAGILDWAGGNVVHITGGMSGLVTSLVIGKRRGFGEQKFTPNNILHTITGACFLWVGWIGFNGGSAFAANDQAAMAVLNTSVAASCAAFSWILMEYAITRQATVLGMVNGSIAGLISVTPAAGYVDPTGAFFIGLLSGPVCYYGISLKKYVGADDALDAFGLHGVAGIYGGIMTGLFAKNFGSSGAFYGNGMQLGLQIYGIVVVCGWSTFMTFLILLFVDAVIGLRISIDTEKSGLDRSFHGEGLYAERSKVVTPTERVAELLKSYAEAKAKKTEMELMQAKKTKKRTYRDGPVSDNSSLTNSEIDNYPIVQERVAEAQTKERSPAAELKIKKIEFAPNEIERKEYFSPTPNGFETDFYEKKCHNDIGLDLDDSDDDSYKVGVGREP